MSTLFTKIINGEIPGRFVWTDDDAVAFLTAGPLTDGHAMVVPRQEVDHWLDASDELMDKLVAIARTVGRAQQQAFGSERVGLMIQGFEIPHLHVHVWPVNSMADFDMRNVDRDPDPAAMDENAERLRAALREAGHGANVPD